MNEKHCSYKFHTTFHPRSIKHNVLWLCWVTGLKNENSTYWLGPHDNIKPREVCQPGVTLGVVVVGDDAISQSGKDEEVFSPKTSLSCAQMPDFAWMVRTLLNHSSVDSSEANWKFF